jgi:hypothetical protein
VVSRFPAAFRHVGVGFGVILCPLGDGPSLRSADQALGLDPNGVATFNTDQMRPGRVLPLPRGGGVLPTDTSPPVGACRFTAASPAPRWHIPSVGALNDEAYGSSLLFTLSVFPSPVTPDGTGILGLSLGLRTPQLPATHAGVGTGRWTLARDYTFDSNLDPPFGVSTGRVPLRVARLRFNPGGGREDLPDLAHELNFEVDDLLSLVDGVVLLGFATVDRADLELTDTGKTLVAADILASKQLFARQARQRAPLVRAICQSLATTKDGTLPERLFLDVLRRGFSEEEARRQLDTAIDWGRYAELFDTTPTPASSSSNRPPLHKPGTPAQRSAGG